FEIRQGLSGKERRMQGQISQLIDISIIEPFEKNSGDLVLYTGGGKRFRLTKGANRLENLALISDIIEAIEKQQLAITPAFKQALVGWKAKLVDLEDDSCWKGTPVIRFKAQKTHDGTQIEIPAHDLTGWLVGLFWLGIGMSFWGLTHLQKLLSDMISAWNFHHSYSNFYPTSSLFKQPGTLIDFLKAAFPGWGNESIILSNDIPTASYINPATLFWCIAFSLAGLRLLQLSLLNACVITKLKLTAEVLTVTHEWLGLKASRKLKTADLELYEKLELKSFSHQFLIYEKGRKRMIAGYHLSSHEIRLLASEIESFRQHSEAQRCIMKGRQSNV
ncbi:MAG: hypothetical protein ACAI44_07235, partial [Candidatus Sericytochromatia bacterium]